MQFVSRHEVHACAITSSSGMEDKEKWMQLCEQAAVEKDPAKLLALVAEINRLLEQKEKRLGIRKPEIGKE
jgi:hypothetical protein